MDAIEGKAILYPYLIHIISVLYPYYIYVLIFAVIEKYSNNYKIVNWCWYKWYIYITSGINLYCSKMDSNIFFTIVKNTNAVKYSHFQANNLRHQLSLLAAILILIYFSNIFYTHILQNTFCLCPIYIYKSYIKSMFIDMIPISWIAIILI